MLLVFAAPARPQGFVRGEIASGRALAEDALSHLHLLGRKEFTSLGLA